MRDLLCRDKFYTAKHVSSLPHPCFTPQLLEILGENLLYRERFAAYTVQSIKQHQQSNANKIK
jgi:hypothetical protein